MDVHSRPVVKEDRLGHEGGRLAGLAGDVLDDVLVFQHIVGHFDDGAVPHVNLALTAGRDFVMMSFDVEAAFDHGQHHFGAQIIQSVGRRTREISFLIAELISEIRPSRATSVPGAFALSRK